MQELSKKTRKELRTLKAKAHAKEIEKHLVKLSQKFDDWNNGIIDCWDLSDHIHEFHNGISHDLFNAYNAPGVSEIVMVSRGLALGLLQKDEIPEEVADCAEQLSVELFEKQ